MGKQAGEMVIVSGPPGAGKSRVAEALAHHTERSVHLPSDDLYGWIRSGYVPPHQAAAQEQNRTVIQATAAAAASFASGGYRVFWDGVVGPWFLDVVLADLPDDLTVSYLVLRPSRATALGRVHQRDRNLADSGAADMWDQFADLGHLESHVIDAEGSLEQVVRRCREALDSGTLHLTSR